MRDTRLRFRSTRPAGGWQMQPMQQQFTGPAGGDGSEDGEDGDADPSKTLDGNEDGEDGDEDLRPEGQRAFEATKKRLREERTKRQTAEQRIRELEAGDDEVKKAALAREAAINDKANARIVRAEIRATAAGKLADPADAIRFLDAADFSVDDDGEVDEAAIAKAIDDLVKGKPYLAASGASPKSPKPDRRQGAGSQKTTGADAGRAEAARRFGDRKK